MTVAASTLRVLTVTQIQRSACRYLPLADLCRDCYRSIESWYSIHKLFKKEVDDDYEMDPEAEQEVQTDVGLEEVKEDET